MTKAGRATQGLAGEEGIWTDHSEDEDEIPSIVLRSSLSSSVARTNAGAAAYVSSIGSAGSSDAAKERPTLHPSSSSTSSSSSIISSAKSTTPAAPPAIITATAPAATTTTPTSMKSLVGSWAAAYLPSSPFPFSPTSSITSISTTPTSASRNKADNDKLPPLPPQSHSHEQERETGQEERIEEPRNLDLLLPRLASAEEEEERQRQKEREEDPEWESKMMRGCIREQVQDLVLDPVSLLLRPNFVATFAPLHVLPPLPPLSSTPSSSATAAATSAVRGLSLSSSPSPSPFHSHSRTSSASSSSSATSNDPAAGYLSLNATNLSSSAPEVVEFGRAEGVEHDGEESGEGGRERRRKRRFVSCLEGENVDLAELRKLAWAGIPDELRPMAWQLLLGYLPSPSSRRATTLARKRQEYADAVRLAFARGVEGLDSVIWHQICIDVPRTNSSVRLWQGDEIHRSLERILYVWAIRHPASGYVQGINDLVTPFFQVFLSAYITSSPEKFDIAVLPPTILEALEADSFWCLSKLLDGIQDNYIFAQPGITRQVGRMKELCKRVDAPLSIHLELHQVEFIQFAFRWMNCLLMRELSVSNIVRMWDTYLAEGTDAFSEFHLYVCLAFLVKWSDQLREMDFQSIIMFLQSLPTQDWTDKNTELLLSEAFMWSRTFQAR